MDTLSREIRQVLRQLARHPGFAIVTIVILALAIGTTVPTFSIIEAYLLRPLPFERPDELVHVWSTNERPGINQYRVAVDDFLDWRESTRAFSDLAAFNYSVADLTASGRAEQISVGLATSNLFETLGRQPQFGRGFVEGEDHPGAGPVVILSNGFWRDRYQGSRDVLGRTIEIDRKSYTIIGVMPEDFVFPLPTTQLWFPYELERGAESREVQRLQVVGRLADTVTPAQAQRDLDRICASLAERYPETNEHRGANVTDLRGALNFADEIFRMMSVILMAAHLLVLLIACANISGVLLARSLSRTREIAIRAATGASRTDLVRQLLTESLVLALVGGVAGLVVAWFILHLMQNVIPGDLYRVGELTLDPLAVLFTIGLALLAAIAFGLVPALRASGFGVAQLLRESASSVSASQRTRRLQNVFVIAQIGLAAALLVGTLMIFDSFKALRKIDPGFDHRDVLTMRVVLPDEVYDEPEKVVRFHRALLDEAASIPGVRSVATVNFLPLNHESRPVEILDADLSVSDDAQRSARMFQVSPDYFETLDIPLVGGRDFAPSDRRDTLPVAIVSEALRDRLLGGRDPLGRTLQLEGYDTPFTIIGVAGDTRQWSLTETNPQIFVSQLQFPGRYLRLIVEAEGDPLSLASAGRAAIGRVDSSLAISEVRTMEKVLEEYLLPQVSLSLSVGVLGLGAIALAAVGLYGLMLFFVNQQKKELGVRMALGATRARILGLVLRRGLLLSFIGVVLGLAGSLVLSRPLGSLLQGNGLPSIASLVAVPAVLIGIALMASWIPARAATRVEPVEVLRVE